MCISTVIAEYSIRIEDRNFAPPFQKLEPSAAWSKSALVAWSVIDARHLVLAESDARTIARAWLNSNVRKWNKECDAERRRQNTKDENGNLTCVLHPSESPLREFAEASCRSKSRYRSVLT